MQYQNKRHTILTRRQQGVSLVEALAWIAIAGIVIAGAVSLFLSTMSGTKNQQFMKDVMGLRVGVQGLLASQGTYGAVSLNSALISAKKVPATLPVSGTTISNQWGGTITVTGAGTSFTVTSSAMPKDACMESMTGAAGWLTVNANGAGDRTPPVAATQADTDCSSASANSLVLTSS